MAYIDSQKVKEIREHLKKEFSNLKFSVRKENFSKLVITVKSGNVDFLSEYKKEVGDYFSSWHINCESVLNDFVGNSRDTISKIAKIAFDGWHDRSDAMTDYFDTAYYVVFNIGLHDEPYIFNQAKKNA